MNKAKIVFKLIALTGVPLTGYLSAIGYRRYSERGVGKDAPIKDKVISVGASYGPAIAAGALTVGSIIGMDHISTKELVAATGMIALNKKRIESEIRKANAYRQATLETVGEEKESEIRQLASDIHLRSSVIGPAMTDEVTHIFHLDWFDEDIYFESTFPEVLHAFSEINRELFDYNSGHGLCKAYKFFEWINHPELIDVFRGSIEKYGWSAPALIQVDKVYWLPFHIVPHDEEENTFDILTAWYPNENIEAYQDELEAKGVI